mgnify:CR=1 FL=1
MNKQKKEIKIDKAELNEKDLEKVDGGIRVVVGDGKMGTCKRCGTYAYIIDGYCSKCAEKIRNGQ